MASDYQQITSFQNSRVKQIKKLRDKRGRERESRFVIDDGRDLRRALACGYAVDYALYAPQLGDLPPEVPAHAVYAVTPDIMQKAAYRQNPSAIVAVMHSKPSRQPDDGRVPSDALVLVLVGLNKPGNVGALLRTADATGCTAVWLVDCALDRYNPNIIRASTGACFMDNIYELTADRALAHLHAHDYRITATLVDGDVSLFDADLSGRVALVMGTEEDGLSAEWALAAAQKLVIPMAGRMTDSLNVSVSGALCLYEALRQRRDKL
ncbi:MAG: RNA methyltransferase [Anaerolineaceae bacterium]|nr:MAG: RNA methyltransferase [Anaerolineaceae bacterium]